MNEFLMEEAEIIKQDNYIELSPLETLIPVGYFLIFIFISGLVLHIFPAKKDKSSVLPLGLIGGTTILLLKIYILAAIDGFDLILHKTTIFPFNLLSILGIYSGISLGIIYSSKSRAWNFKKEEKPILNIRNSFFKILTIAIFLFGLKIFIEGFIIKYNQSNFKPNVEHSSISNLKQLEINNIYSEINEIEIEKTYENLLNKYQNEELFDVIQKDDEEFIELYDKNLYEDEVTNSHKNIEEKKNLETKKNDIIKNNVIIKSENNSEYRPNREYTYQPQLNKNSNKNKIEINNNENSNYIPNRNYNYEPKINEESEYFTPETQKLKNY